MHPHFRTWLESQQYTPRVVASRFSEVGRVEEHFGGLDALFVEDELQGVLGRLKYTASDERNERPNPSPIPISGNLRNGLASLRSAIGLYVRFKAGASSDPANGEPAVEDEGGQRIGLERDMQAALRLAIQQLERGLEIIDDGAERSVDSGLIDITARDQSNHVVVIELKAGRAGQRAVAQILSYMGDIAVEESEMSVRGILIASDFDHRARAAARMIPNLALKRYSVRFQFADGAAP